MAKFEYYIFETENGQRLNSPAVGYSSSSKDEQQFLDELGSKDWELVSVIKEGDRRRLYLKKAI